MGARKTLAMFKSLYPRMDINVAGDGFLDGTIDEQALELINEAQESAGKIAFDELSTIVRTSRFSRCITNLGSEILANILEHTYCELSAIVSDITIRHTKLMHNVYEVISNLVRHYCNNRFSFNPLGELVYCNKEMCESTLSPLERTDHIQSLNYKGP
uniref:Retrotransposon protein, putative, Ty3-gypsy subclass n=1 Tax=Oryza sativa subsp. japonica TaxID=39947 RepID=Q7G425_ORYSJ|nr:retrotransposon protein, putative, Ty3-gypsy subclass [Oryza sativa Japonica Group]